MLSRIFMALVAVAFMGAIVAAVVRSEALPDGPEPVAWDRTACDHCHMHVGEPPFAAQLQTKDGAVLHFDDPGCLLLHLEQAQPQVHALWFHHVKEDRWVHGDAVAFVDAAPSPMGHGLGAVDAGTAGAITLQQATERIRAAVAPGHE